MKRLIQCLRPSRPVTSIYIVATLFGIVATFGWITLAKDSSPNRSINLIVDDRPIERSGTVPRSFSEVVKEVSPSVVRVNTTSDARRDRGEMPPPELMPWLDRFFDQRPPQPNRPLPQRNGLGSGVIVSSDGYILTNNHVIQNADRIEVVMPDSNRGFDAELIGRDPKSDLAVLKIDAENLPYARIGNSDQLAVGDLVLAVGNPFGVGQTVTMGIVSATGRASMGLDYEDFIQTDAAINPGNSGGALVDIEGRLIGINTAILSKTGANQGIGFAIPTNLARNVMEDLIESGRVNRGFLGVMIQDLSPDLADYFDRPESTGALVADVTPGSPAAKAGLESGDVITRFNDTSVRDSRHLKLMIGAADPNTDNDLSFLRNGAERGVTVRLAELADNSMKMAETSPRERSEGTLDGVRVTDLDPRFRSQYQLPRRLTGALVVDVDRDSPSWGAGLRPGDVIREINRSAVDSADDAIALSEALDSELVLLRVWRQGSTLFLAVDEGDLG